MRQNHHRSPENLYNELLQIANVNSRFRSGKSGAFTLNTYEEEANNLTDTYDLEHDGIWPTPVIGESYEFRARRVPRALGKTVRSYIDLSFVYKISMQNTELPVHIAEDAYGLEGEEAIENGGPSEIEHFIGGHIDSKHMKLAVCEGFTYKDDEDDEISTTCSCVIPHTDGTGFSTIMPKIGDWAHHDNDDDEEDDDDEYGAESSASSHIGGQSLQFNSEASRKLEVIETLSEQEMNAMMNIGDRIQEEKSINDLVLAYNVMRGMKRAFKRQLGLQIPPR